VPVDDRTAKHAVLRAARDSACAEFAKARSGFPKPVQRNARPAEAARGPGIPRQCRKASTNPSRPQWVTGSSFRLEGQSPACGGALLSMANETGASVLTET